MSIKSKKQWKRIRVQGIRENKSSYKDLLQEEE